MDSPDLLSICFSAFAAVFFVLISLAVIMRIIITMFPEKDSDDTAIYAAIATTINSIYPGTQISKIEELK